MRGTQGVLPCAGWGVTASQLNAIVRSWKLLSVLWRHCPKLEVINNWQLLPTASWAPAPVFSKSCARGCRHCSVCWSDLNCYTFTFLRVRCSWLPCIVLFSGLLPTVISAASWESGARGSRAMFCFLVCSQLLFLVVAVHFSVFLYVNFVYSLFSHWGMCDSF